MMSTSKTAFIWVIELESQDPACSSTDASDVLYSYEEKSVKVLGMGTSIAISNKALHDAAGPGFLFIDKGSVYQKSRTSEHQMRAL